MHISNTTPRSRTPARANNADDGAAPLLNVTPVAVGSNPQSGAQAARTVDAIRNRLSSNQSVSPRTGLRVEIDAVRSNPRSASAFFRLGLNMTSTEHIDVNGIRMNKQQCYLKAA
jgi:hypothetical protein